MWKKRVWICICIFSVVVCIGCYDYKKIEIGEIKGIKVNGISFNSADVILLIPIENPNNFSFKISKLDAVVFFNEMRIGVIENTEKIKIQSNTEEIYEFSLQVEYSNPLTGLMMLGKMLGKDDAEVRVKGYLKVRAGIFSKKILIDEQSTVEIFKDM